MPRMTSDGSDPLTSVTDLVDNGTLIGPDGTDRLLSELVELRRLRNEAEQRLRYLVAYAREFVYPRPYRLVDIATAAGLSVSGVRIFYSDDEIRAITAALDKTTPPHH